MNPFHFGNSKSPLYGVFHKADQLTSRHGVVLCAPFGQEYMRSHRALRQLASMLSRIGVPVLRFDYRGTGDSAGELGEVTCAQWMEDINLAIDELKDTAGVEEVSLIGLRLGGLLATHAILEREDIVKLILWDPVISGDSYIKELKNEIKAQPRKRRSNYVAKDGTLHYNGFSLTENLQLALTRLSLKICFPSKVPVVLQIVSHDHVNFTELRNAWTDHNSYEYRKIDAPGDWNYVDKYGSILLPQQIIQGIVNEFNQTGQHNA